MYTRGAVLLCSHRQRENYQDTGSLVCTSGGLSSQVGFCRTIHLSIILTIQPIHPCIYLFNLFTNHSLTFIRLSLVMFNVNPPNINEERSMFLVIKLTSIFFDIKRKRAPVHVYVKSYLLNLHNYFLPFYNPFLC